MQWSRAISSSVLFLPACYFFQRAISSSVLFLPACYFFQRAISSSVLFLPACYFFQRAISSSVLFLPACYFFQRAISSSVLFLPACYFENNRMLPLSEFYTVYEIAVWLLEKQSRKGQNKQWRVYCDYFITTKVPVLAWHSTVCQIIHINTIKGSIGKSVSLNK